MTSSLLVHTAAVVAMALGTVWVATALDGWVGDFGALLWVCACFFIPFITGIAWGPGGLGKRGRIAGALLGGLTAVLPTTAYVAYQVLASHPEPGVILLPLAPWAVFGPLGMAQGAISLPVGASARKRRRAV